jgi:hypothetical protein
MNPLTIGALMLAGFAFLTWATAPAKYGAEPRLTPNAEDSDFCMPAEVTGGAAIAYHCHAGEIGCKTHPVTDCEADDRDDFAEDD